MNDYSRLVAVALTDDVALKWVTFGDPRIPTYEYTFGEMSLELGVILPGYHHPYNWGIHCDLCPVDSCVNLLSALDSRNGVMSMRTSPHLRVCGATCGMHVFAGFVDKFFGHFRPEIRYGALPRGSRNLYKMLPIYSSSIWHKAFDPPRPAAIYNLTKSSTAKSLTGKLQRIRSAPQTQLSKVWLKTWKRFYSDGKCPLDGTSQWTHDMKITSLWRQNDVATSFWHHNDVIVASCARWDDVRETTVNPHTREKLRQRKPTDN